MMARLRRTSEGFSLIEVLVSVLVVAVGLVGVSKMQAAGVANSQIARTRSLVALQASSLAAAMRGNPGYWAATPASPVVLQAGTITESSGLLATFTDCTAVVCTPTQLAAFDLKKWVDDMNLKFPTYNGRITCATAAGAPNRCLINISWQEKYISVNRGTAASSSTATTTQQFTLVVEP